MTKALPAVGRPVAGIAYYDDGREIGPAELIIDVDHIALSLIFRNDADFEAERFGSWSQAQTDLPNDLLFVNLDHRVALTGCRFAGDPVDDARKLDSSDA